MISPWNVIWRSCWHLRIESITVMVGGQSKTHRNQNPAEVEGSVRTRPSFALLEFLSRD
jgi:hypothetical protein